MKTDRLSGKASTLSYHLAMSSEETLQGEVLLILLTITGQLSFYISNRMLHALHSKREAKSTISKA